MTDIRPDQRGGISGMLNLSRNLGLITGASVMGAVFALASAYRRDRHKDRLLQENGYTVLRFLAEDFAKDLDTVLDAVLRSLTGSHFGRSAIRLP